MNKHKVVVIGGGTFNHISCHLSLAAPAFGGTAKKLHKMFTDGGVLESHLVLTKMADPASNLITNADVALYVEHMLKDKMVKVVVMNAAICDFEIENPGEGRLSSSKDYDVTLKGIQGKILATIRKERPDIVVAGFKTTHGATPTEQLAKAAQSMHNNRLDFVLANDVLTRNNILLTLALEVHQDEREELLEQLVKELIGMYRISAWLS
jgi:phosphopantothenoylcysteine synthetase/decarboxylase